MQVNDKLSKDHNDIFFLSALVCVGKQKYPLTTGVSALATATVNPETMLIILDILV